MSKKFPSEINISLGLIINPLEMLKYVKIWALQSPFLNRIISVELAPEKKSIGTYDSTFNFKVFMPVFLSLTVILSNTGHQIPIQTLKSVIIGLLQYE